VAATAVPTTLLCRADVETDGQAQKRTFVSNPLAVAPQHPMRRRIQEGVYIDKRSTYLQMLVSEKPAISPTKICQVRTINHARLGMLARRPGNEEKQLVLPTVFPFLRARIYGTHGSLLERVSKYPSNEEAKVP